MTNAKRLLKHQLTADEIVGKLLVISNSEQVCLLDSCGVSHLNSHFLIGGINPIETFEITNDDANETLQFLDHKFQSDKTFAIFTISYDFGLKLEKIKPRKKQFTHQECDVFLAIFDTLLVHDYDTNETYLIGNENCFDALENRLNSSGSETFGKTGSSLPESNFSKSEYLETIDKIKELIRRGDTYQTNLTQQIRAELPEDLTPQQIFHNLRRDHPAPFASFIQRSDSTAISASPERFFKVASQESRIGSQKKSNSEVSTRRSQLISASPTKGTRPRGRNAKEDQILRRELLNSAKDRAENVMIVDLLRNDLGRICEFGSIRVEKLCDLEEHPTLFHLVSTISGKLRENVNISEIIRAVFPCGSITGAPKIRTMKIIDALETANRGLSMGAIGFWSKNWGAGVQESGLSSKFLDTRTPILDLSVAIRTMVIKGRQATFNVGGGIVIDSDPEDEYKEALVKAKALLQAINGVLKS